MLGQEAFAIVATHQYRNMLPSERGKRKFAIEIDNRGRSRRAYGHDNFSESAGQTHNPNKVNLDKNRRRQAQQAQHAAHFREKIPRTATLFIAYSTCNLAGWLAISGLYAVPSD
ncbi:hypothetical protein [Pseudomonas putida]|uniref:hypothetical protein n=1 Tax=Pseudomonas putida TaxID=303 RepID=UPI001E604957|nr:hypothetical protein [Pseudomonas putida]MCE0963388.1 hypothetical protein [Pseudomonas putida]